MKVKNNGNNEAIRDIDTNQDGDFEEWAGQIVNAHAGCGCSEDGEESGIDKGEEEHVVSQVDEIRSIADHLKDHGDGSA